MRVNWSPVTKNGATLKTGDIVSVSGKGRLKVNFQTKMKSSLPDCLNFKNPCFVSFDVLPVKCELCLETCKILSKDQLP